MTATDFTPASYDELVHVTSVNEPDRIPMWAKRNKTSKDLNLSEVNSRGIDPEKLGYPYTPLMVDTDGHAIWKRIRNDWGQEGFTTPLKLVRDEAGNETHFYRKKHPIYKAGQYWDTGFEKRKLYTPHEWIKYENRKRKKAAAKQAAHRAKAKQAAADHAAKIDAFVADHPVAGWLLNEDVKGQFLNSLKAQLTDKAQLSDKQLAALEKVKAQVEAEPTPTDPLEEGRYEISGKVLTIKETDWGPKLLIALDDGNKVYGSCPSAIEPSNAVWNGDSQVLTRGKRVQMNATVERSKDDDHFGFYKRPAKASIITDEE